jgi:hypothetical protein
MELRILAKLGDVNLSIARLIEQKMPFADCRCSDAYPMGTPHNSSQVEKLSTAEKARDVAIKGLVTNLLW